MELVEKIHSKVDKTIKYIFKIGGQLVETSYIDNGSDKDIICVASQTMCNMKCSFCHLTDLIGDVKKVDLAAEGITAQVHYIFRDLNLQKNNRRLHISYMGAGEPLDNFSHVKLSMLLLNDSYDKITFGLATIFPKKNWSLITDLIRLSNEGNVSLKLHLSLHYTDDKTRSKYMPSAMDIKSSISALEFYKNITGNPVEVHYTIIKGQNDRDIDATRLASLLAQRRIPVKFLQFNEKSSSSDIQADIETINFFRDWLGNNMNKIDTEHYVSPGHDISASCGEFLLKELSNKQKTEVH